MNRWWSCLLLVLLSAGMMSCGEGEAGGESPVPPVVGEPVTPVPTPADAGPWVLNLQQGQALFEEKCQHCHGIGAAGGYGPALTSPATCTVCAEFSRLWRHIDEFMPFRNPEACDATCARNIAAWISNGFSTAPSCSVDFRYESVVGRQFTATIRIANFRGRDVPQWRLGFSLPPNHGLHATRQATATLAGNQVLLTPFAAAPGIAHGAVLEIGLEGTHDGLAITPDDLRLEASPCFSATPSHPL